MVKQSLQNVKFILHQKGGEENLIILLQGFQ